MKMSGKWHAYLANSKLDYERSMSGVLLTTRRRWCEHVHSTTNDRYVETDEDGMESPTGRRGRRTE